MMSIAMEYLLEKLYFDELYMNIQYYLAYINKYLIFK